MTKFTSLLIGSGDSFLIETGDKSYMIDSGGNQKTILSLIPKRINIAICTHNDSDHCKGFIGILNSNNHTIDEIWLPGLWAPIIDFMKKWNFDAGFPQENFNNIDLKNINLEDIDINELLTDTEENIDDLTDELGFLSDIEDFHFWRYFRYNINISNKIYFTISRILQIAKLAYNKGVAIKWFFPDCNGGSVINNFKPINCKHLLVMKGMKNQNLISFFQLAFITSENKHSLVFEYLIDRIPRILFTADSLISITIPYSHQIIVTAPHHGSHSNSQVYNNVKGEDLIWVRSDRPSFTRPCDNFLNLNTKYCLSCTKKHPVQRGKIIFKFNNGKWNNCKGQLCKCNIQNNNISPIPDNLE